MEELELVVEIDCATARGPSDGIVTGLCLEGAAYVNKALVLSEELRCTLPPCRISWTQSKASTQLESGGSGNNGSSVSKNTQLVLPIYKDQTRETLISEVRVICDVTGDKNADKTNWCQRSVAILIKAFVV